MPIYAAYILSPRADWDDFFFPLGQRCQSISLTLYSFGLHEPEKLQQLTFSHLQQPQSRQLEKPQLLQHVAIEGICRVRQQSNPALVATLLIAVFSWFKSILRISPPPNPSFTVYPFPLYAALPRLSTSFYCETQNDPRNTLKFQGFLVF